ncbi:MAG TPA: ion channel [Bryobacteraceae bacterium]|nr:ion channel [Bryobacteraceae bacterium]
MQPTSFDPGLTQQYGGTLHRAINKDGSFNVDRRGGSWRDVHPYLHLINASWPAFLGIVMLGYLIVNTVFAFLYFALGAAEVQGTDAPHALGRFLNDFFFSAHTLTTVGYGNFAPAGIAANAVAAFEAFVGLMGFALATGLLFGRVSKPSAKIGFSEKVLIVPYQDRTSLQFRIVNLRSNVLIELSAVVTLMTVENSDGKPMREFKVLPLERDRIYFFPLTWTVVHPIDESSPLFGRTAAELARLQAEVLILIKGFDDTFSQTVNARYSYRYDEIAWGAKFNSAFHIDDGGNMVLDVDRVGDITSLAG